VKSRRTVNVSKEVGPEVSTENTEHIVTAISDYRWGFGLDIDHVYTQLGTMSNCRAIADFHTLQIIR
jgi:hypothetical protein